MDFSWKYLLVTLNYITQGFSEIKKYKPLISYTIPTNHQTNMQYVLREQGTFDIIYHVELWHNAMGFRATPEKWH